ncbi:MAG: IS630 family transposase [Phycisphaerae bacterium]|nr:IS630 family transposase [Phycisphaerae bacterium]NIX30221.1 IS630 family transposase [Phycisphaerae bacterium]
MDESTLGWLPVLIACWMKRGCQKRIPTPGVQQWRHIFGAYNWATDEVITLITEKRNSDAFIDFLDHLVAQHDGQRPLVIVLDNGSIHRSYATQAAFAILEDELLPVFLPKYCSQLNPIERFWKHLKAVACANKLFPDMEELVASVEQALIEQNDLQSDSRFMFLKYLS